MCLVRWCESMLTTTGKCLASCPVGMFQGLLMPWSQLSKHDWCHGHGSVNTANLCGLAGALRVMWSLVGYTVFAQREVWRPSSLADLHPDRWLFNWPERGGHWTLMTDTGSCWHLLLMSSHKWWSVRDIDASSSYITGRTDRLAGMLKSWFWWQSSASHWSTSFVYALVVDGDLIMGVMSMISWMNPLHLPCHIFAIVSTVVTINLGSFLPFLHGFDILVLVCHNVLSQCLVTMWQSLGCSDSHHLLVLPVRSFDYWKELSSVVEHWTATWRTTFR